MMYMFNSSKTCVVKLFLLKRIEIKTKEIHFSLFHFHFNYVVYPPDATVLARDKQNGRNGDFLNYC